MDQNKLFLSPTTHPLRLFHPLQLIFIQLWWFHSKNGWICYTIRFINATWMINEKLLKNPCVLGGLWTRFDTLRVEDDGLPLLGTIHPAFILNSSLIHLIFIPHSSQFHPIANPRRGCKAQSFPPTPAIQFPRLSDWEFRSSSTSIAIVLCFPISLACLSTCFFATSPSNCAAAELRPWPTTTTSTTFSCKMRCVGVHSVLCVGYHCM